METERLVIAELEADELEAFLPVYLSNPEYLALTEGSGGEAGRVDLDMLERDVAVASFTPGRVMAGIRLKATGEPVGVLDWLEDNPSDGKPWIGLVLVAAEHQRRGLATEAVEGLVRHTRWPAVRAGVIEGNTAGLALVRRLGFVEIASTEQRLPGGLQTIRIFERSAASRDT